MLSAVAVEFTMKKLTQLSWATIIPF